jgi:hypothetical protein
MATDTKPATPFLEGFIQGVIYLFMMPGNAMVSSLQHTSWGRDLITERPHWTIIALLSLVFWSVLCGLLDAGARRVNGFLSRNDRR